MRVFGCLVEPGENPHAEAGRGSVSQCYKYLIKQKVPVKF